MKLKLLATVIISLFTYSTTSFAGPYTAPNLYTDGNTLTAAELNSDNAALETAINDNDARITSIVGGCNDGLNTAFKENSGGTPTCIAVATPTDINALDTRVTALETPAAYSVVHHVFPNSCQRSDGSLEPLLATGVAHPTNNAFGPSIYSFDSVSGQKTWYCPITIDVPTNKTITIINAKLAFYDGASTCLVGAGIKYKTFGASSFGTDAVTPIYSGADSVDFNATPGLSTKDFTIFSHVISPTEIIWVQAIINWSAVPANPPYTDWCRFSGVEVTYTVQ